MREEVCKGLAWQLSLLAMAGLLVSGCGDRLLSFRAEMEPWYSTETHTSRYLWLLNDPVDMAEGDFRAQLANMSELKSCRFNETCGRVSATPSAVVPSMFPISQILQLWVRDPGPDYLLVVVRGEEGDGRLFCARPGECGFVMDEITVQDSAVRRVRSVGHWRRDGDGENEYGSMVPLWRMIVVDENPVR